MVRRGTKKTLFPKSGHSPAKLASKGLSEPFLSLCSACFLCSSFRAEKLRESVSKRLNPAYELLGGLLVGVWICLQSPKIIIQRPKLAQKSLKFHRKSDAHQVSGSKIWSFGARKTCDSIPYPNSTPFQVSEIKKVLMLMLTVLCAQPAEVQQHVVARWQIFWRLLLHSHVGSQIDAVNRLKQSPFQSR